MTETETLYQESGNLGQMSVRLSISLPASLAREAMPYRERKKISAITALAKANLRYNRAVVKKYGRYIDDEGLYVAMTGKAWTAYLKAGGSPSMINYDVPPKSDFNATYKRLERTH